MFKTAGGYARIASLFKQIREEKPDGVITLDNGDTIHGTFPAVNSKGYALVPILNKRIQELFINNEKFDPDKVYHTCFVTSKGIQEHHGRKRKNLEINAIEAFKLYLEKYSPVTVELMNTIVPI